MNKITTGLKLEPYRVFLGMPCSILYNGIDHPEINLGFNEEPWGLAMVTKTLPVSKRIHPGIGVEPLGRAVTSSGQGVGRAVISSGQGVGRAVISSGQGVGRAVTSSGQGVGRAVISSGQGVGRIVTSLGRSAVYVFGGVGVLLLVGTAAVKLYQWYTKEDPSPGASTADALELENLRRISYAAERQFESVQRQMLEMKDKQGRFNWKPRTEGVMIASSSIGSQDNSFPIQQNT